MMAARAEGGTPLGTWKGNFMEIVMSGTTFSPSCLSVLLLTSSTKIYLIFMVFTKHKHIPAFCIINIRDYNYHYQCGEPEQNNNL